MTCVQLCFTGKCKIVSLFEHHHLLVGNMCWGCGFLECARHSKKAFSTITRGISLPPNLSLKSPLAMTLRPIRCGERPIGEGASCRGNAGRTPSLGPPLPHSHPQSATLNGKTTPSGTILPSSRSCRISTVRYHSKMQNGLMPSPLFMMKM